jgi:hypothetical protein
MLPRAISVHAVVETLVVAAVDAAVTCLATLVKRTAHGVAEDARVGANRS